jgi:hypothetical protein
MSAGRLAASRCLTSYRWRAGPPRKSPRSKPRATHWAAVAAPSLSLIAATWAPAVRSEIESRWPISW